MASPKKTDPKVKDVQTSSQLVEASLDDDNISVYYNKAINRYESQKHRETSKLIPTQAETQTTDVRV